MTFASKNATTIPQRKNKNSFIRNHNQHARNINFYPKNSFKTLEESGQLYDSLDRKCFNWRKKMKDYDIKNFTFIDPHGIVHSVGRQ
jgi:hypothetical protein